MISNATSFPCRGASTILPMGSSLPKSRWAKSSSTTTTGFEPSSSRTEKSRPLSNGIPRVAKRPGLTMSISASTVRPRSEEHTSELQSRLHLVCRLLLEKKKTQNSCQHKQSHPYNYRDV